MSLPAQPILCCRGSSSLERNSSFFFASGSPSAAASLKRLRAYASSLGVPSPCSQRQPRL